MPEPTEPNVVVVEPKPRWTPELQRQFVGDRVHVRQCVRLGDAGKLAGEGCVLVLDFDAAPADCLQFLGRRVGNGRYIPSIVIGSPSTAALEWTARDLGALAFLVETPPGAALARLCRRQWTLGGP